MQVNCEVTLTNERQKTAQVTWFRRQGQVTCLVTWLKIGNGKQVQGSVSDFGATVIPWREVGIPSRSGPRWWRVWCRLPSAGTLWGSESWTTCLQAGKIQYCYISWNTHMALLGCALLGLYWVYVNQSQIARSMWPTWGPPGSYRPQVSPMLAPWTLLSAVWCPSGYNMPGQFSPKYSRHGVTLPGRSGCNF